MNSGDLNFLYEIGSLRNTQRGWRQHLGMDVATVPEHIYRVIWLALIIARKEDKQFDESKLIKMALVHDVAETRVSDLSYVQKVYVKADEEKAANDLFIGTAVSDYAEILKEYEKRECLEAKIVKDADNLDVDIELKEFEERGSRLTKKWREDNRQIVRDQKLYTETAKKMWDEIQPSDPSEWHRLANKWLKIPSAGL